MQMHRYNGLNVHAQDITAPAIRGVSVDTSRPSLPTHVTGTMLALFERAICKCNPLGPGSEPRQQLHRWAEVCDVSASTIYRVFVRRRDFSSSRDAIQVVRDA